MHKEEKGGNIIAKPQHVTPHPSGGWQIKGEGNSKPTKITSTKVDAIKIGTEIAKNQKTELVIHNLDGKIGNKNSFGNDPCPPKDKK